MKKLAIDFYDRKDVVLIAKELLGKLLVTNFDGEKTIGRIVETEAYVAINDKASHAFGGKRTARNEHMYSAAGISYVYICYGMHHLFNIVTNVKDVPDAVLIRALEPVKGIDIMLQRTGKIKLDNTLTRGPGNVGRAMGINKQHSGSNLLGKELFVAADGTSYPESAVGASKRIGVDYAGDHALLPYRFYIKGNKYVSGKPNQ